MEYKLPSLEEHVENGRRLKAAMMEIHRAVRFCADHYPQKWKVNKKAEALFNAFSPLLLELDRLVRDESTYRNKTAEELRRIYFGPEPADDGGAD